MPSRLPIPFVAVSILLVAMLLPGAFLRGEVLTQSSILYQYPPWQAYTPADVHAPNPLLADPALIFYPLLTHAVETVQRWELPRWSAALYAGYPFLGSIQTAIFSPFTAIAYVVPLPRATIFIALAPLVVGGTGMFLFVRSLGLTAAAAWFAGLAYLLNGFAVVWMEHPLTAVVCWTPWLLRATDALMRRPDAARAAGLAVVVSLVIFAGHPETSMKVFLLAAAYAVAALVLERRPCWRIVTVAGAAGVLLAAIQLAPFVEYLAQSEALLSRESHTINSFYMPAATMITALVPDFFGNPAHGEYLVRANRFGVESNYAEQAIYAGIPALVIASVGFMARRHEWRVPFFAIASVVSLALMYGFPGLLPAVSATPLLRVMILSRFGIIAIFSWIVLAAYGVDWLTRDADGDDRRIRRTVLAVTCAAIASIAAGYVAAFEFLGSHGRAGATAAAALVAVALLGVTAGLILVRLRRRISSHVFAVASCAILVADLIAAGWGFHPTMPPAHVFPSIPELEMIRRDPGLFRVYGWGNALMPNAALPYGLQDIRGWDGMNPSRYTRLLDLGYLRQWSDPERHLRDPTLLDLLNVKYVFVGPDIVLPAPRYSPVPDSRVPLYVNRRALPRAFLVDRYQVLPDEGLRQTLHDGTADLSRVVLLESDLPADERPDPADVESAPGHVHIRHYRDTFVEMHVESFGRTLLVMSDAYYPGWIATIDEQPVTIHRANFALRAISVPPGEHVVRFEYRPLSVRLGAAVSLATIAALLAAVLVSRTRGRRPR